MHVIEIEGCDGTGALLYERGCTRFERHSGIRAYIVKKGEMVSTSIESSSKMSGASNSVVQHGCRIRRTIQVNSKPSPPLNLHKETELESVQRRRMIPTVSHVDQKFPKQLNTNNGSKMSSGVVQHGQRKGTILNVSSAQVTRKPPPPVDQHKAITLYKDLRRILDSAMGVNKEKERLIAAKRELEDMYLCSKEISKNWPDTFVRKRQELMDKRKIRKETECKAQKRTGIENAKLQAQKRKEEIDRTKRLQFNNTDRVKKFQSALMLSDVQKERETQIEVKKQKQKATEEFEKETWEMMIRDNEKALQQERVNTLERKKKNQAFTESLKQQIKERELARMKERMEENKESEELKRFHELCKKEEIAHKQMKQEETRNFKIKAYQEHLANKKLVLKAEAETQALQEKRQKNFVKAKDNMEKLWKEKEAQKIREAQRVREAFAEKVAAREQEKLTKEEELTFKVATDTYLVMAKQDKRQREEHEKRAAVLKNIAEHRRRLLEQEQYKKQEERQKAIEMLNTKKGLDMTFHQKELLKAQDRKKAAKMLKDAQVHQMAEKQAQKQHISSLEKEFEGLNADFMAENDELYQKYVAHEIQQASEKQRDTTLLRLAAKQGINGELGFALRGVIPRRVVLDQSGVQLPRCAYSSSQAIKRMNETINLQDGKDRLGFTWEF